jgi:hypothetical protein
MTASTPVFDIRKEEVPVHSGATEAVERENWQVDSRGLW